MNESRGGQLAKSSQWRNIDALTLLAANVITLVLFIRSGSIMQVLLTYCLQTVIAGAFYYRRIRRIRLFELEYVKKTGNAIKTEAVRREVAHQIPHEQFMFLFVFILPLTLAVMILLVLGSELIQISTAGGTVEKVAFGEATPSFIAVTTGGLSFLLHQYLEYRHDIVRAQTGQFIKNRYRTFVLTSRNLVILYFALIAGPLVYHYFGSNVLFGVIMLTKTGLEGLPALIRIHR
jgi:hypothetical protein